jgi:uncharacterized protein YecE (DUF72 family)
MPRPALSPIRIGCAGWNLPRASAPQFPATGSHLDRYAARFNAVEINTSFYRPHRAATYAKWAASVPAEFRFSVKVPREITHDRLLTEFDEPLAAFLEQVSGLGDRLGCLLVQLPPRLEFDRRAAGKFFSALRGQSSAAIACEPRHVTWFTTAADKLLARSSISRVAADPIVAPGADRPDDWSPLAYYRLHGSPRMYYSSYPSDYLAALAERLQQEQAAGREAWCIFDNTALGAATENGLEVMRMIARQ